MNQNKNGNGGADNESEAANATAAKPSFAMKAGYVGTGILIGLVIYPFVRKTLTSIQPKMDKFFEDLTGRAENMAEKASDLMAKAKETVFNNKDGGHKHDHDHSGH